MSARLSRYFTRKIYISLDYKIIRGILILIVAKQEEGNMRKVIFLIAVMLILTTTLLFAEEIKLTTIIPKTSCFWTKTVNATSGKNDISNNNDGNVGIGTTASEFRLTLDKGATTPDGGILAIGTLDSGTTLTTAGAGTRLFWYPKKAAFRAGNINASGFLPTQWDDANIGQCSVAMGEGTTASGNWSTALGKDTTASGTVSTALGDGSQASGSYSAALVGGIASGYSSTAMGWRANASGDYSIALGNAITVNGKKSVGIGIGSNSTPSTVSASNVMAIMGGNVGIGMVSPSYLLDVAGDIRATGSVYYGGSVGSANGVAYSRPPDYVFSKGYNVMGIDSVEAYLIRENHLPWMTPLKYEKRGVIDMTRMNFETVETVENLQLQIISLNKELIALKSEVAALKKGK